MPDISDIRTKRAAIDAEIDQLLADRDVLDRALLILDPTARIENTQPKARRRSQSAFKHGEFGRIVRNVLRVGGRMTLADIADRIVAEHNPDMERDKLIAKIRASLRDIKAATEKWDGTRVWWIVMDGHQES